MSALARTALRLAGIQALLADPVIAGLCAGRVFDSRIEDLDQAEPVPVIVVLTEDMEGHAWSANNGGPPFDDHCELVLEIAMRGVQQPVGGTPTIVVAETDSELEASLDLIEQRAVFAVTNADTPQAALLRRAVTRRVSKQTSMRYVAADTGMKLAVRSVQLTVELKGETVLPAAPATGAYAAMPDPLRTVCGAMPAGSTGAAICKLILAALPTPPTLVPFGGIDATVAPQITLNPGAPPIAPGQPGSDPTIGVTITIPSGS